MIILNDLSFVLVMSTDIEDFKSAYLRICSEQHVDAQDSVVRKIVQ